MSNSEKPTLKEAEKTLRNIMKEERAKDFSNRTIKEMARIASDDVKS
jgi:hypothetical protein